MSRESVASQKAVGTKGRFGELDRPGNGGLDLDVSRLPVRVVAAKFGEVQPGDTVWLSYMPVQVAFVDRLGDMVTLTDSTGRTHPPVGASYWLPRASGPLASFDDVDWQDRAELDDYDSGQGHHSTLVRYNADGYGQVSAFLTGGGDFGWHGRRFLGELDGWDPDDPVPSSDTNLDVDDGPQRTKGDAFEDWMSEVAGPAIVNGVIERYGWDVFGYDGSDSEVQPAMCATNVEPGEMDEETIANLIHVASVRFRNESDPGTFNAEYPYAGWIDDAVRSREAAGLPGLPW